MLDVRGYFLGPPHGTKLAAVTANKTIKISSFKNSENIQRIWVGQADLSLIRLNKAVNLKAEKKIPNGFRIAKAL